MSRKKKLYTKKLLVRARRRQTLEELDNQKTNDTSFRWKHDAEMRKMLRGVDTSDWT